MFWILAVGTGNAALAAARLGAKTTGIDVAGRLLQIARQHAENDNLPAVFKAGDAQDLPFEDATFDVTMAVFSSMFAPNPDLVATEMHRVTKPTGRMVFLSWVAEGPINEISQVMRSTLPTPLAPPPWSNPDFLRAQFQKNGRNIDISRHSLDFYGASPAQWWNQMEHEHPAWRFLKKTADAAGNGWVQCAQQCLDILGHANKDKNAFRVSSDYWVTLSQASAPTA